MTDTEYKKQKLAQIKRHLRDAHYSGARGSPTDETVNALAAQLADALDRLSLEMFKAIAGNMGGK